MSTLHQYRWSDINHCQQRLHYIDSEDTLIIYGTFTPQEQHRLLQQAPFLATRCFWLSDTETSVSGMVHINYQQWLTLITEHDKTHTWK